MEDNVLPSAAVAEILNEHYVEARLFTDMEEHPHHERILELQDELAGTLANPTYVLVDPASETKLATFQGQALQIARFVDFLKAGVKRAEKRVAAK
jgi:hypothetical protein